MLLVVLGTGAAWAKNLTWKSTSSTAWETNTNWFDEGTSTTSTTAPTSADNVVIDGSRGATVNPSVTVVGQAAKTLVVGSGFVLTISNGGAAGTGLSVGDGLTGNNDITIQSGGEIDNLSAMTAGTAFTVSNTSNDKFRIDGGGKYVHGTARSFTTPFPASQCDFDAASSFVVRGSSTISAAFATSGRTYGNYSFESSSGTWSGAASGAGTLTVNGNFSIGTGVTITTTQTGVMTFAGNFTNNGTLTNSTGTQVYTFTGSGKSISGTGAISFETFNVNGGASITLSSPVTIASTFTGTVTGTLITGVAGTALTNSGTLNVNGTLQINAGTLAGTAPVYGGSSTLTYNTGGTYSRGLEWSATSGAGYPNKVQVSNSTTLDLGAGGTGTARALASDLTIDPASTLTMNNGANAMTAALTVNGNVANNGTLTQSSLAGGDLILFGNFIHNSTFNTNGRAVYFRGGNTQQVSRPGGLTFDFVRIEKSGGTVQMNSNVTINGTGGGDQLQFNGTTDVLNTNGNTLTLNGATVGGTNSAGALSANPMSNLVVNGSGALGTLRFITGGQNLGNLTLNRSAGSLTLGSDLTVNGTLLFSDGKIVTGSNTLFIASSGSVSGASSARYVNGNLNKRVPISAMVGNQTWEIGDATRYTPVDLFTNTGLFFFDLTFSTTGGDHPNVGTSGLDASKTVNRYWTGKQVLTTGGFSTVNLTFHFDPADVDGGANTSNFVVRKYDSPNWTATGTGTQTATSTQATGITGFSDFQIGEILTHTITATAGSGGTISPSGAVTVNHGANQTFTISPSDACHAILDVKVDGVSQGAISSYTFTNVTTDHTIDATFSTVSYTITATAGSGGSISPSGAVPVACNGSQTFTISPSDACHAILDVKVDGVSQGAISSYTFSNVTANHTIDATFSTLGPYTITATAGPGGSISPSGAVSVACGGSQTFSISPSDACHAILDVKVDGVSQGAISSYTFSNVAANHTIDATFSALGPYTITASAGANGSISPSGAVSVACGGSQSFTITPNSGYYIFDVLVDGSSVGGVSNYTFSNVTANHTISASFAVDVSTIGAQSTTSVICPTNTCVTVPVTLSRHDGTPILGYSVTFQLSPELSLCAGTSSITEGTFLSSQGPTLFQVADHGGGSYSADCALTSNCGQTASSGTLFSIAVTSTSPSGPGTITITSLKLRDCSNTPLATAAGPPATVPIDNQAPSVAVTSPNGGESWVIGSSQTITWTATDNVGVASVDLAYSTDGGATYPNPIATGIANSGSFVWTVPNTPTTTARVRVTAHDVNCSSASDASDANFTIRDPIITATAGSGGSISPSGAVSVPYGTNQSFAITPADKCHAILDVKVDGVSQGPIAAYTFNNVTTDHTIAATFSVLGPFTITASAGPGGSISPSGPVSVACGGSQSFAITPGDKCHFIADVKVDGVSQGAIAAYTFTDVQANHTIAATFGTFGPFTITATAGTGGSITPSGAVSVNCGDSQKFGIAAAPCYHILDVLVDGSSVGAVTTYTFTDVQANHTIAASFAPNALSTTAVTNLAAAQVRTGNDGDGTTKITITYTTPAGAASVEVWRKGYGSYPTYDDGGGSVPPVPGSYPPAGWALTGVTASGQTDEPATRDFWYYVAYAKDGCGNVAPVSNETGGTLNYHLGDVSDGFTAGQGDNKVNTADLSLLGAHYGLSGVALAPYSYLDVGPTTDHSVNARPTTDGVADFEDLVMFALNYFPAASAPQTAAHPVLQAAARDEIALEAPGSVNAGDVFEVRVRLAGSGDLQAVSAKLAWNEAVATPLEAKVGELVTQQGGVMFSPGPGGVDAALLGARDRGMIGDGVVAMVRFRALAAGSPALSIASVIGRDAANHAVTVAIGATRAPRNVVTVTALAPAAPNPMRSSSLLEYSLARGGPVDLSIYSVDGRRVRTLVHETADAGQYQMMVGSSRVDLQACKLEYSIVSPK